MSGAPAPAQPNNPAASVSPTMPSSLEDVFFASSMQLNDQGNGVYTASVPLSWTNGIGAAHGGWALGLNLNAVLKEVSKKSPHLSHPMSSTSQYLAPAHPRDGGVKITVTVLRRGKRFAFAESRTENGKGELAILATFCIGEAVKAPGVPASIADHGPQLSIESMRYPEMIPPNECEDFGDVFMKGRPRFRPGGRLRPQSLILSDPRYVYFVNRRAKLPVDGGLMDMPALCWASFVNREPHSALSLTYFADSVLPPNLHVSVTEAYRRMERESGRGNREGEIQTIGWSTLSLQCFYPHPLTPGCEYVLARSEIELASPSAGTGTFQVTLWDPTNGNVVCVGRQSCILPVIRKKIDPEDRKLRAGVNVEEEDVVDQDKAGKGTSSKL